jgi:cytoskeletal protein CcmA (bactofilin family)
MTEVIGTNTTGPGVSGTGSSYGVIGASTGTGAGVVGKNASNGKGPGIYAQTDSVAPGLLAISGEAGLVDALFSTDLDTAAVNWGAQYTNKAGLFVGDVHLTGSLTAGTNVDSQATFAGPMTIGGALTGSICKFEGGSTTGVHGVNGSGSGDTPKFGCGVLGESNQGYGVYGASKTASGVYGKSQSGLAGEFEGNISATGDAKLGGSLDVGGKVSATGDVTLSGNLDVKGSADVDGTIKTKDVILSGADCAEEFDIANAAELEPGTVVVFDDTAALVVCSEAYDKRAAGVISGAGDYRPGVILDRRASQDNRAPVALVGKVFCKVDATYAAIEIGDLLTTSPTPGCAMKASDQQKSFGAVIGKALSGKSSGLGLLPILVALQ